MFKQARTLRGAIVLVVVFGLLVPALLVSGYSWFERYDQDVQKRTQELLQQNAEVLSNGMQEPLWNISTESGQALLDAMMMRNEDIIRIEVRDTALGIFVHDERPERRIGYTASTEKPVMYHGSSIGTVQIEVGSTRLRRLMIDSLEQQMSALAAQIVLSIVLILILLEKRLVGPLQKLRKGAERLAGRQLDIPFTWNRLDEIGLLSRRLEATRISLRTLFEDLDKKNQELELDIDMRKSIEQELHEREARFRALVEQSPIAIIEWDSHHRVLEWNASAERIFGYTRQQAIGQHGSFINPYTPGDILEKAILQLIAQGESHNITENIHADGHTIICQWSNTHIADESGHTGRLLSMAEDITEKRWAEEALRSSEQRFSTIFQSSPVAMFLTQFGGDNLIKDVNSAFERLFMRSRDSIIGKNTAELAMYVDNADRNAILRDLGDENANRQHEVWMLRGDGSKVLVQVSAHTFVLDDAKFAILACEDVTDKRRIENEILELNAHLEQRVIERTDELQQANQELASTLETLNMAQEELVRSEKLAALGSLVAGIAHELNTPIGNSLMVASTLVDQTKIFTRSFASGDGLKRSVLENYLGDANKAGDILVRNLYRAANLVTSFKQVAVDQTSSQRRSFSLAEVISEIMLTLWPSLKKTTFVFEQNIPKDLSMDSYPGPLGQVVANLVNNALLHGFEGRTTGTVTLSAQLNSEGWVELTVKDDGVGIPATNLNLIFDPFFTTKLGAGGSGLGLNITHNIVSGVLGGRIRVHSAVGRGTTFVLTLPKVAPQRQAEDFSIKSKLP
jgi:PAS domain S-box-containing protein